MEVFKDFIATLLKSGYSVQLDIVYKMLRPDLYTITGLHCTCIKFLVAMQKL